VVRIRWRTHHVLVGLDGYLVAHRRGEESGGGGFGEGCGVVEVKSTRYPDSLGVGECRGGSTFGVESSQLSHEV
jgi:hypothetical protein